MMTGKEVLPTGKWAPLLRQLAIRNILLSAIPPMKRRDRERGCLRCGRPLITKHSRAVRHCLICRAETT